MEDDKVKKKRKSKKVRERNRIDSNMNRQGVDPEDKREEPGSA